MKKTILIFICSMFLISYSTDCFAAVEDYEFLTTKETSNIQKAIHLAKNSCSHSLYCYLNNKHHNINEIEVPRTIRHIKGPVHIFGWAATKYNDQTYIVTYVYEDIDKAMYHVCAFDVNLEAEIVRVITGKKQINNYDVWYRVVTSYKGIKITL